ncbi:hypothetical protein BY996DRAFT_4575995 [Phakopsora pachyrhizi]|uniref:CrcB-like protein n=1 Tax=Phakopsora pachyrhizi TaxID=170000 RepID=A0AAV0AHT7_PHAPC|nr:hypothetical protein BY996DRAFT_4575995 [Phakopsora pachyrhizi]CAH7667945.1 hypothetical protein PPACK8108_LOCUS2387 [Phakopsora pachyrhizi]
MISQSTSLKLIDHPQVSSTSHLTTTQQDRTDRLDFPNQESAVVLAAGEDAATVSEPIKSVRELRRVTEGVDRRDDCSLQFGFIRQAETHSLLIFFAVWGLLTRLGLSAVGDFAGRSVFSLLLVQVVGCFTMGFSVALKDRLDDLHPLLYLGLTTGYCGSVTTFSSWMIQVFQTFARFPGPARSKFYNFLDGFNQTYVTFGMCIFALKSGFELATLLEQRMARRRVNVPTLFWKRVLSAIIISLGPATWLGSIILFVFGPSSWRGDLTYSMIISPTGTLARFYLGKINLLNISTRHGFPFGTFLANSLATGFLAALTFLQYTSHSRKQPELCGGLQGLKDGFCGCLSTISTFFFELFKARLTSNSVRYFLASWIVGQTLCVLFLGTYLWTHELDERCEFPK